MLRYFLDLGFVFLTVVGAFIIFSVLRGSHRKFRREHIRSLTVAALCDAVVEGDLEPHDVEEEIVRRARVRDTAP